MATRAIALGANIQTAVTAGAAGDTYTFAPGIYYGQTWTPKQGDIYLGDPGGLTVLSGARRILTAQWVNVSANWYRATQGCADILGWETKWDNNAGGGLPFQQFDIQTTFAVPVPVGTWFQLETFTHRASTAAGRFWAKINGATIADRSGSNIGVNNRGINRIFVAQNYTNGHVPSDQWVDDIEIWDGVP